MKWYLAGPICHVTDGSDIAWREEAKKELDYIDPFEEESKCGLDNPKERLNELRSEGDIAAVRAYMQTILEMDADCVDRADGVLAYSPGPTWGTIREVSLAYQQGKPAVIWTEAEGWDLSNTLIGMSAVIVSSLKAGIATCRQIEQAE